MDTDAAAAVAEGAGARVRSRPRSSDVLTVFAVMWAAATLFHVWGPSGRVTDLFTGTTSVMALQAAAAVAAIVVLARPRAFAAFVVMVVLGPLVAWFEAPVLGSHWTVVTLVDVGLLLATLAARRGVAFERAFVPVGRWVLIGFYCFAAFAKLNHAFFTPTVSCGTYYLDELAQSLHLSLHSQAGGGWTHLVPFAVAGTELSIPILLLVRRTRHVGVVVGLVFHSLIALDQTHLFSDFSSVLAPLFVLFLPPPFASDVVARWRALSADRRERVRAVFVVGAAVLLAAQFYGRGDAVARLFADGRAWAWVIYDVIVLALVGGFLWSRRPAPIERPLSFGANGVPKWLAVVPALVVLTGLAPFLELRTAYAFNMYSNLRTADGDSNHFLVTRTLPLTDFQSDLVRITATDDPGLRQYVVQRFDIPFLQLRDYLSRNPDVQLAYVRKGVSHSMARAGNDLDLVRPVPSWESKLFAFRSLDQTDPTRCQPSFLPAL
ncbi:MAG TPA: hypothetical protein VGZ52_00560 [Acidimicrobiales bacterium]|nr:hypothetical protein [Acidimicrobiales bacterium]